MDPANPTYRRDVGVILTRLGDLARDLGDVDQARAAVGVDESLLTLDPDNETYRRGLGVDRERLDNFEERARY